MSGRSRSFKLDRIVFALAGLDASMVHDLGRSETREIPAGTRCTFNAIEDFPDLEGGEVPYYRDQRNGAVVSAYRNTHVGAGSPRDMAPERHTWYGLDLQEGDTIAVESIARTNGEIPEGDGTAWL